MNNPLEKFNIDLDTQMAVERAAELYVNGGLFIYPTDTIYGFGCNPFSNSAMKKLNNIKGRVSNKQYILLVEDVGMLSGYADVPVKTLEILSNIWPAPVSTVLNLNSKTEKILNHATAAFRIPDHSFCRDLLDMIKSPLVSTSVNFSNETPLVDGESILRSKFTKCVDAIFYTAKDLQSEASTLVDLTGDIPIVLRKGKINFMELWKKLS
ncbi:MAG: L-threonylcarbamoyladenylate synthase [Ignavibacteria bacterium]|jgi:L-threonylcarbamoyladenylate synthase